MFVTNSINNTALLGLQPKKTPYRKLFENPDSQKKKLIRI